MPLSPDEMRARDYLELLNNYEVLKKRRNVFGSLFQPGMDHFTYWIYLNTAVDSDMKQTILQTLEQEMIKKGLNKMNQAQVPGQEQSPEPGQQ
ncbi:hypothetical protein DRO66_07735 [Candidatus Bathyarchaeota archaeon]|nr:MAG: hypothetical protein DRO66_07735 [Candidatus Bathyarchaeota archaeon]